MDGHAIGHSRTPGGIGASIELGSHFDRQKITFSVRGGSALEARRMAFRAGGHGFDTRVDATHGLSQRPGPDCQ